MVINRYLSKEIFKTLFAVLLVLLLITLSNKFAHYLQKAAAGELPINFVFQIVFLYIPELLTLIVPFGFFITILLAYGKLHADSEMIILFSSGYTWSKLSRLSLFYAVIVSILLSCLTLWSLPKLVYYRESIISQGQTQGMFHALTPGEFHSTNKGNMVFYLESRIEKDNKMHGVFIAEQNEKTPWQVITANYASLVQNPLSKSFFLTLEDGFRYKGKPGNKDYTVIQFSEYGREVAIQKEEVPVFDRVKETSYLINSNRPGDIAELQWRISVPLSLIILTILAIPLSKVNPRQGRFAKFLPAIVLYIVYYNLLLVSKRWVSVAKISPNIGVWWVHLLFLMIGLFMLGHVSGAFRKNENNR